MSTAVLWVWVLMYMPVHHAGDRPLESVYAKESDCLEMANALNRSELIRDLPGGPGYVCIQQEVLR